MRVQQVTFFTESSEITAVEHLRVIGPLQYAGIEVKIGIKNGRLDLESTKDSQAFIIQREFPKNTSLYQSVLREAETSNIPVILDLDDNLLNLPKEHPARISGFYSKALVPLIHALFRVDAIFVTNKNLANQLSSYNKEILILPNYLDDNIWNSMEIDRSDEDPLKLLYMGTLTHAPDLIKLKEVFKMLSSKYQDIQLISVGIEPPEEIRQVLKTTYVPQLSDNYAEFALKLPKISGGIAIAPLVDNSFNRAKSPLKYFEYSAVGLPAVYSNIDPYAGVVQHGRTGFLATEDHEWVEYLEQLISNSDLRRKIATEAYKDVYNNWNMRGHSQKWIAALDRITRKVKQEKREPIAFLPDLISVSEQLLEFSDLRDKESQHMLEDILILQEDLRKVSSEKDNLAIELQDLAQVNTSLINDSKKLQEDLRKVSSEKDNLAIELQDLAQVNTSLINDSKKLQEDLRKVSSEKDNLAIELQDLAQVNTSLINDSKKLQEELNWNKYRINAIEASRTWRLAMKIGGIKDMILKPAKQKRIMKGVNPRRELPVLKRQSNSDSEVMPSRSVGEDEVALIRNSELFDQDWYLERYPDVKDCRMDPAMHYYIYGGFEGRNPSSKFCSSFYFETYPDVKDATINPLVHYLVYGKNEGRLILPESNHINPLSHSEQFMEAKGTQGNFIQKSVQILRDEGLGSLVNKAHNKIVQSRDFENAINEADSGKEIEISIVIPAYNAIAYTNECIDKVYKIGSTHTFEVIVVDNASADETQAEMEKESLKRTDFSYYRMKENLGFAGGVNFGIQKAKGQYVVILNNDTLPTAGWLDDMVVAFETNPTLGIVSPVTNYVGEGPQLEISAKDIKPEDIDTYALGLKGRDVCYEPGRLVFFCVMIRRSVFEQIGLLDENYIKGNFEDDDYCLRAILSGYKLGIAKSAFVFHHGSITFKENKIVHSDHMELNRERFFLKTGRLARSLRVPCEKTQNPQISVIVRTLNRKHLLKNALTSLANQNFRDFKVVLVNDGGESVQDLVDIYSRHFPITYVNHENSKGRTPALNAGVFNSNTKWVAFLDDDDIVYPWHLATLYNHAQFTKNGMMFYSDYNRTLFQTNSSLSPVLLRGIEPWQYDKDQLWVSNRIPMHSWLVARECFEKVGFFDENQAMLEDFEFLVRLSKEYNFYHVNRVTCEYRYYLDGMNSMINQREQTLEALKYIYTKHEAYNQNIENNRSFELEALKVQTEKIELLRDKMNDNPENNSKLTRQMTKLILGF